MLKMEGSLVAPLVKGEAKNMYVSQKEQQKTDKSRRR